MVFVLTGLRFFLFSLIGICFSWASLAQDIDIQETGQSLGRKALDEIRREQHLSQQQIEQIAQEIETLEENQKSLSEALVTSAERAAQLEKKVRSREERLDQLLTQKRAAESVLDMRRREVVATLAVLERLGLQPPPILFVPLDETLHSLRSSSLLGAAMVDLRARAQALRAGLEKIERIEQLIAKEKTQVESDLLQSQMENRRLMLLLEQKKTTLQQSEQRLVALQEQRDILARRADSLQDLVESLEETSDAPSQTLGDETLPQANLISVERQFSHQRGHLMHPVDGLKIQAFDKAHHGELYKTSAGALITTPAYGVVRYAGLFRSYGQLLILDVGQNYHLILAGMDQIYVQQGQVVLAGEPIGVMPTLTDEQLEQEGEAIEQALLSLYIEIRKEGIAIDPAPWWQPASTFPDI